MSTTTLIIAPDGSTWDIPGDRVQDALSKGGQLAQDIIGPDGNKYAIPVDNVRDALKSGGRLAPPPMPKLSLLPSSEMEQSTLGKLWGGPADAPGNFNKVPQSIQKAPDSTGEAIAGISLLGAGGIGASEAASVALPVVRTLAAKHPLIAAYLASEAIGKAREIPYAGKLIPPGSEIVPFLLGGKGPAKAKAAEAEAGSAPVYRDATRQNVPYAGEEIEAAAPKATASSDLSLLTKPAPTVSRTQVEQQLRDSLGGAPPLKPNLTLRQQAPGAASKAASALPEKFVPVENSIVKGFKYNADAKEMEIASADGGHYIYGDISPTEAEEFANSASKSRAWNKLKTNSVLVGKYLSGRRIAVKPSGLSALSTPQE